MSSNGPQNLTGYSFGGSGNYTASVSSNGGSGFAWKAFDKDINTAWNTNFTYTGVGANSSNTYIVNTYSTTVSGSTVYGEWIQIQMPTAVHPYSYTITPPTQALQLGFPYQWTLAGSNDNGTTWTSVDTQNNINTWVSLTPKTFTSASSSTAYSYYRLIVQAVNSYSFLTNQLLNISEWTVNGSNVSWNTDFYADRLGNLLTAPVTGQSLASWLGGATGYVTTWYDQSGRGNHATQATAANQPKIDLVNKQIDFKPSAYFDLPNGTVPFGNSNYTMIVKHNTINATWAGFIGSGTYGTQNATNSLERNSIYINYWWSNDMSGGTYAQGSIISATYDNTIGRTLYVNGASVATNANKNRNSTNIQNTIGTDLRGNQGQSGGNRYLNGELYYVFLFNTALSDTDRTLVESLPIT
jgi:hypothetical protein